MPNDLPTARLIPKDNADQLTILRSRVNEGARTAGRVGLALGKGVALLALCSVGILAIGAGAGRSRTFSDDSIRRMNESLRTMPKIDFSKLHVDYKAYMQNIELARRLDLSRELSQPATSRR